MWVVHNGKTCVMAWDNDKSDWTYIPEIEWYTMAPSQRQVYIEWYMNFTC